jgi:hypothetical protein
MLVPEPGTSDALLKGLTPFTSRIENFGRRQFVTATILCAARLVYILYLTFEEFRHLAENIEAVSGAAQKRIGEHIAKFKLEIAKSAESGDFSDLSSRLKEAIKENDETSA